MSDHDGIHLVLYVAGDGELSRTATKNLQSLAERFPEGLATYECIDILAHRGIAREHRIAATPMLVRQLPSPTQKILGDLSDLDRVIESLNLTGFPRRDEENHNGKGN